MFTKRITIILKFCKILFLLFGVICCSPEWKTELYSQRIEGTSKILYKYDAWGGFDSHAYGFKILDSLEVFEVNESDDLPFFYLEDIPRNKTLIGVRHERIKESEWVNATKLLPIKINEFIEDEIKIIDKIYQRRYFTQKGGLGQYHFSTFKETRDSLFFFDLNDVISENGKHLDMLRLKKKCVVIRENETSEVIQIVLEDLKINKESDMLISNITYFLTPKYPLKVSEFSDYGIFKEAK